MEKDSIQVDAARVFFILRRPIFRPPPRSDQPRAFVDRAWPMSPPQKTAPGLRLRDAAELQPHPAVRPANHLDPARFVAVPNPIRPVSGSCSAFPGDLALRRSPESQLDNPYVCCWLRATARDWSRFQPVPVTAKYLPLGVRRSGRRWWSRRDHSTRQTRDSGCGAPKAARRSWLDLG